MEPRKTTHFVSPLFHRGVLPAGCFFAFHGGDTTMKAAGAAPQPQHRSFQRPPSNRRTSDGHQ